MELFYVFLFCRAVWTPALIGWLHKIVSVGGQPFQDFTTNKTDSHYEDVQTKKVSDHK